MVEALTAREAAKVIGVDRRTIYRIKAQLGVLRERPLMLSRDVVVRYKIGHPEERSTAA
jgi:predicted DNA-binding transcriptional regulator YafY